MLSIAAIGGAGTYYLRLANEDYYLDGGEPLGRWWGRGAERLTGLGSVAKDELRALLQGYAPEKAALIQNAGDKDHQRGWDLTFSAPKSVSVLWGAADQQVRREIQAAHFAAVKAALDYLQDESAYTRRGKGGMVLEKTGLTVATFEHGTSRELDPQLHTHALVINVGTRADGTTGTILSKPLYQAKMAAGALYRAELAAQLEKRIGAHCERDGHGTAFHVVGVLQPLCDEFSKRAAAIAERLRTVGSSAAAAAATLETRRTKQDAPPRSQLFDAWKQVAETFGFKPERVINRQTRSTDVQKAFADSLSGALREIVQSQSHFTEKELLQRAAVHAQGTGIGASEVRQGVKSALRIEKGEIVPLGMHKQVERFTTKETLAIEKKLIDAVYRLDAVKSHGAGAGAIESVLLEKGRHLTDEQRQAVRYLTGKGGGLRSLEGWAGTGKTSTLAIAREVLEKEGYRVIGATLSAKASKELEAGAKVESNTIALLDLKMGKPGPLEVLKHEGKQLAGAMLGNSRSKMPGPLRFTADTVLVIDESAMVATKELAKLAVAVEKAGGMLISVFDRKQLQAIGPGGGAAFLADKFGKADLTGIVRQHEEWMRDAVKQFANGDAAGALRQYQLAGRLHVADDRDKAVSKLVSDWMTKEKGRREGSLIFVSTLAEAAEVNARCQAARMDAGEIESKYCTVGEHRLHGGDRVLFTKNSSKYGVQNGTLGTVLNIVPDAQVVAVKLDSGSTAFIPLRTYKNIQPGYAVTTHKGQGTTVDNAYLLAGGKMQDRHLSYVQASRARESTSIYSDRHESGDELTELAKQMSKEREKTLAHDIAERVRHEHHPKQSIGIRQEMRI